MIAICNYKPWVISLHRYANRLTICQRVDIFTVYDSPHLQETKQYLVLALQHYVIRCRNT